jgi:hypothetical protein
MALNITRNLYRSGATSLLESGVNPSNIFADGLIYTITGTGFGSFTGFDDHIKNTPILSLSDNSNFGVVGRWDGGSFVGAGERFKVVSEGINGKCLKATRINGGAPNITLLFNYDSAAALSQKVFTSVWVKHLVTGSTTGGQWKYGRWQKSTTSLSDKPSEAYWNASSASPDNKIQVRDYRGLASAGDFTEYGSTGANYLPHARNKWVRMDILHTLPSAYNLPDEYKCEAWIHDPDSIVAPYYTNFTNNQAANHVNPYGQAGDEWLCHLYQNYLGNGDFDAASHTLWMDKCYESVGNNKRVELANNSDLTLATRRFIQPRVSWADTTIQVRSDIGDIPSGSRWIHTVVDGVSTSVRAV